MTYRTARAGAALVVPLGLLLLAGCVERRMVITTGPFPEASGAIVYDERNVPLSASPADRPFTYYGKYRFKIVKDGYETLIVEQDVPPPWYELPGLDFISENLLPWTARDIRRFHYELTRIQVVPPEQVLEQAKPLRAKGQSINVPEPPPLVRPGVPTGPSPPGILTNPGAPAILPRPEADPKDKSGT